MFSKIGSQVMRASAVWVVLALPTTAHDLPVVGRGTLTLPLPSEWKEVRRITPKDLPPTIEFERSGSPRGSFQLTVLWSPKNDPDFSSQERVREFCVAGQSAFKGGTIEQEFPLKSIKGIKGDGFFYDATDKNYKVPQGNPTPGDFPVLTHGELGTDRLILSFTIMSDEKGDHAVNEALDAIRKAVFKPEVSVSSVMKVQGAGVELLMNLDGFVQKDGVKIFHGAYAQIGFFTSGKLNLSVLVDDLNGKSLPELEKIGIGQSKGMCKVLPGQKVNSESVLQANGFLISFPCDMGTKGYFQGQWYFETIRQGKWLELHFSKVFKEGEDIQSTHAEVLRVVRSIQSPS